MSTIILPVQSAKLPSLNPSRIEGAQKRWYLLFDDTIDQSCQWQFRMPNDYVSSFTAKLQFSMADTQTGINKVKFSVSVMAVTPEDAVDIETDSFDGENTGVKTLDNNQVAGYLKELSIPLTNADNVVAGDLVIIKIVRDADDVVDDTAIGDAELCAISLEYS